MHHDSYRQIFHIVFFCKKNAVATVRVSDPDPYPDPDPYWIRIQSDHWIRIRIRNLNTEPDPDPGGQKLPTKVEKIHVFKCWMASFVSWRLLL